MTKQLITLSEPRSPTAEAYRSLYINISFSGQERQLRTLLVTSSMPDEGKSTTLANLAIVAAQMGQQVILADCDLRQPRQHTLFGLSNSRGVSSLAPTDGSTEAAQALQSVAEVPGLRVLTSGPQPASPAQVLASKGMENLLASLAEQADLVLLDSPPVTAVSDASVLAARVDGVLLVLSAGQTKRESARRAREALEKVGATIIGAVLNNAAPDASLQSYYR